MSALLTNIKTYLLHLNYNVFELVSNVNTMFVDFRVT